MVSKPRLQHTDLVDSDLTAIEKQRERVKRWLAHEKSNPARALELKQRNTANKREQRRRKRELEQANTDTNLTNGANPPPKRRRTATSQTPSGTAGPSNPTNPQTTEAPSGSAGPSYSSHGHIPIDPILLNEETSDNTHASTPNPILLSKETSTDTRVLCDVEVMTETPHSLSHSSSPPHAQTPPSPTLSTLTDLESMDLATSIIGKQVHELSKTVQWSDGSTTVLPCIMSGDTNILQDDANSVAFFASLPESQPETSKHVVHLQYSDWTNKNRQLCDEISAALRLNKAVVIRQVSTPKPETLDLDYLEDRGMSDLMRVVVHGEPIQTLISLICLTLYQTLKNERLILHTLISTQPYDNSC